MKQEDNNLDKNGRLFIKFKKFNHIEGRRSLILVDKKFTNDGNEVSVKPVQLLKMYHDNISTNDGLLECEVFTSISGGIREHAIKQNGKMFYLLSRKIDGQYTYVSEEVITVATETDLRSRDFTTNIIFLVMFLFILLYILGLYAFSLYDPSIRSTGISTTLLMSIIVLGVGSFNHATGVYPDSNKEDKKKSLKISIIVGSVFLCMVIPSLTIYLYR